jgi:hypothetical protein
MVYLTFCTEYKMDLPVKTFFTMLVMLNTIVILRLVCNIKPHYALVTNTFTELTQNA